MDVTKSDERFVQDIRAHRGIVARVARLHPAAILIASLVVGGAVAAAGIQPPDWMGAYSTVIRLALAGAALFLAGVYVGQRISHTKLGSAYPTTN